MFMKKATIAIVSFLVCLRFVNSEERRTLTVDDYFSIPELSSPQISPDGQWVVVVASDRNGPVGLYRTVRSHIVALRLCVCLGVAGLDTEGASGLRT